MFLPKLAAVATAAAGLLAPQHPDGGPGGRGHRHPDAWRDAIRRHAGQVRVEDLPRDRVLPRGEVTGETDFGTFTAEIVAPAPPAPPAAPEDSDGVPLWAADPPADRLVVVGPLENDPAAARAAARRTAAGALAEAAGVPDGAVSPKSVDRLVRRSGTEAVTRSTGANEFTVHCARLLVDVSGDALDRLRRDHRRSLADGRAGLIAGLAGAAVGAFGGLWGVGRGRLRRANG